jgi:DNA replication protein DnaC
VREAYEAALHLVSDPSGWLMLQGGYGCGKTHLAAAIANAREEAGDAVYFAIVPDLLDHLRAAFAPTAEISYDTLFERVRNASLLVLDDLGSENGTAWAAEKRFRIINHRYIDHMSTVITTNSRLLTRADDRIRSRLADRDLVRPVVMEAADYRERYAGRPRRTTRGQGR